MAKRFGCPSYSYNFPHDVTAPSAVQVNHAISQSAIPVAGRTILAVAAWQTDRQDDEIPSQSKCPQYLEATAAVPAASTASS